MEEKESCPFCSFMELKNDSWMVMWEPFPVNIGHVKIIPARHEADLFSLTEKEQSDFWELFEKTKTYLDQAMGIHKPDGYNVGINYGGAAGQTIKHLHIHVIPRYNGDVENPRGGVRNIKEAIVKW